MKKKTIFVILVPLFFAVILIAAIGYIFGFIPANTSTSSYNKLPNSLTNIPTIPPSSNPQVAPSTIITFDFDRGLPIFLEGQNTPFSQTSGGVTASFNSASDPAAFSIQSYTTTFYSLSQFSGKYLFDNKISRDILYIAFSQPLNEITFTFATIEFHGPGNVEEPSTIKLTTYMDSIDTQSIGIAYAKGVFSSSLYPQGTMLYNSGVKQFNLVKIELIYQELGGTDFLVDNINVKTAP